MSNFFWKRMIGIYLEDMGYKDDITSEEYIKMRKVFEKSGGSWQGLAQGGTEEVSRLKKLCKSFKKYKEREKDETE